MDSGALSEGVGTKEAVQQNKEETQVRRRLCRDTTKEDRNTE